MFRDTLHIYIRSSITGREDGGSLERQMESGIQKSKFLNMNYQVWHEGGQLSSEESLFNRPILRDLLRAVQTGDVKQLFVWSTDRLCSNEALWTMIKYQYLVQHGVGLYLPTGQVNLNDPMSKTIVGLLGSISRYDHELRNVRLAEGRIKSVKDGYWKGGPPPYGYDIVDSKLVINDQESQWVRFIYELYREGSSIDEIRKKLLQNGVSTRRGKPIWSHRSIDLVLSNTHFGGYWTMTLKSGETVKVSCPRILDATLIKQVQERKQARSYGKVGSKRKTTNTKHDYLAKELLVCGHCGSRFGGKKMVGRVGYYQCLSRKIDSNNNGTDLNAPCRGKRRIRTDTTDQLIWNTVVDVATKSALFKASIKEESANTPFVLGSKARRDIENQIKSLTEESESLVSSIAKLATSALVSERYKIRNQSMVKNLQEHQRHIESEIQELEAELSRSDSNKRWVDWSAQFGEKVDQLNGDDLPFNDKKNLVEALVDSINVSSTDSQTHELSIEFKLPYVGNQPNLNAPIEKSSDCRPTSGKQIKKLRSNLSLKPAL